MRVHQTRPLSCRLILVSSSQVMDHEKLPMAFEWYASGRISRSVFALTLDLHPSYPNDSSLDYHLRDLGTVSTLVQLDHASNNHSTPQNTYLVRRDTFAIKPSKCSKKVLTSLIHVHGECSLLTNGFHGSCSFFLCMYASLLLRGSIPTYLSCFRFSSVLSILRYSDSQ